MARTTACAGENAPVSLAIVLPAANRQMTGSRHRRSERYRPAALRSILRLDRQAPYPSPRWRLRTLESPPLPRHFQRRERPDHVRTDAAGQPQCSADQARPRASPRAGRRPSCRRRRDEERQTRRGVSCRTTPRPGLEQDAVERLVGRLAGPEHELEGLVIALAGVDRRRAASGCPVPRPPRRRPAAAHGGTSPRSSARHRSKWPTHSCSLTSRDELASPRCWRRSVHLEVEGAGDMHRLDDRIQVKATW